MCSKSQIKLFDDKITIKSVTQTILISVGMLYEGVLSIFSVVWCGVLIIITTCDSLTISLFILLQTDAHINPSTHTHTHTIPYHSTHVRHVLTSHRILCISQPVSYFESHPSTTVKEKMSRVAVERIAIM